MQGNRVTDGRTGTLPGLTDSNAKLFVSIPHGLPRVNASGPKPWLFIKTTRSTDSEGPHQSYQEDSEGGAPKSIFQNSYTLHLTYILCYLLLISMFKTSGLFTTSTRTGNTVLPTLVTHPGPLQSRHSQTFVGCLNAEL